MRCIDELHLELPFAGARMLRDLLRQIKCFRTALVASGGRCHLQDFGFAIDALAHQPEWHPH
ncbi:hypothetical protein ACSFA8_20125 [Variovorax sp. RT4R15]|uniref:hypothetical protein n=1 Tax=Variovorax sp. RT4R15 TaxID=3443737 RepID=UPI003F476882